MADERPKPQWELRYLDKSNEDRGKIGVGWDSDNGSIRIVLNPKVVLSQSPDIVLTLFRWTPYKGIEKKDYNKPMSQEDIDDAPF